jgi:hypothetical protein
MDVLTKEFIIYARNADSNSNCHGAQYTLFNQLGEIRNSINQPNGIKKGE